MRTLLIATTNQGKVDEIAAYLSGMDFQIKGLKDLEREFPDVEETGDTYLANALIKGEYYHSQTGLLTLADDSGLSVDWLDGRPGVYSARYGGEFSSFAEKIAGLLEELKDAPAEKRTAEFVCSVVIIGSGLRESFEGRCRGLIAFEPRGEGGFGYDPVFIDPETGLTFAELSKDRKATKSHRGKALSQVKEFLEKKLIVDS